MKYWCSNPRTENFPKLCDGSSPFSRDNPKTLGVKEEDSDEDYTVFVPRSRTRTWTKSEENSWKTRTVRRNLSTMEELKEKYTSKLQTYGKSKYLNTVCKIGKYSLTAGVKKMSGDEAQLPSPN